MILELFDKPVGFFLLVMTIILVTPLISERVRLPGIVGIIIGGMLIGPHGFGSRKRVTDTPGSFPERLAWDFDGNLAILHFDR